jgi:hypothetical protein
MDKGDMSNIIQAHAKLNVAIGLIHDTESLRHKSQPRTLLTEASALLSVVVSDHVEEAGDREKMRAVLRAIRVLATHGEGTNERVLSDIRACLLDVEEILGE